MTCNVMRLMMMLKGDRTRNAFHGCNGLGVELPLEFEFARRISHHKYGAAHYIAATDGGQAGSRCGSRCDGAWKSPGCVSKAQRRVGGPVGLVVAAAVWPS